ncbi:trypsin beta [Ixodes scapularis]|uniref:trypsin beta n=1 Tax=Ixodes scapularis TaxID=6945 RepID=UPI001A9DF783|nr:trypsin beta [Ixodes scapularis]
MKVLSVVITALLAAESTGSWFDIEKKTKASGTERISPRIVNGSATSIARFPWMVRLRTKYHKKWHGCGGAILTPKHVITAAHCIRRKLNREPRKIMVRYGSSVRARMQEVRVRGYYRHERYSQQTFSNDIAVLLLDQALKLSKKTKAIRISGTDADLAGKRVIVAGWGRPEEGASRRTENLRYTSQVVWPPNKCRRKLRSFNEEIHICAYGKISSTCKGDSGGPVMIRNGNNIEMVGLVSYGIGCNRKGVPSGYTRISHYRSWIANALSNNDSYKMLK